MYTSNSSRPVVRYVHTSVQRDNQQPQWWMRSMRRGMMMSDTGAGASAQQGDY